MQKVVLLFPGVGYHTDKPLLFYGRKLAQDYGYEIVIHISYGGFKSGIKGDLEKMREAFESALSQAEVLTTRQSLTGTMRFSSSPRASGPLWQLLSSKNTVLQEKTSTLHRSGRAFSSCSRRAGSSFTGLRTPGHRHRISAKVVKNSIFPSISLKRPITLWRRETA